MSVTFELSDVERALILEILHAEYQDLREEIVKTEGSHYKDMLHERERRLGSIIARLEAGGASSIGR